MYDLKTIRAMNNEHTPAEELGKAMTGAEIDAAAEAERKANFDDRWDEPRNEH